MTTLALMIVAATIASNEPAGGMGAPSTIASVTPATQAPSVETNLDEAQLIGAQLRCPVCQGMPISESPSQMAQDMMTRVREMLAAGKSRDQIFDYFVERYGEWVLLKPKAEGLNLFLWILPAIGLLLGLALLLRLLMRAPQNIEGSAVLASDDEYLAELRREVEQ